MCERAYLVKIHKVPGSVISHWIGLDWIPWRGSALTRMKRVCSRCKCAIPLSTLHPRLVTSMISSYIVAWSWFSSSLSSTLVWEVSIDLGLNVLSIACWICEHENTCQSWSRYNNVCVCLQNDSVDFCWSCSLLLYVVSTVGLQKYHPSTSTNLTPLAENRPVKAISHLWKGQAWV